jgi:predicted MFS family arabinose efflux permease
VALAVSFVIGSARVYIDAAAFKAVASIVGPEAFIQGQSTLSATWSVGFFAGPPIGGMLVALVGPAYALSAEAAAFALATALIAIAARCPEASETTRQTVDRSTGGLRDGLRFIACEVTLRRLTAASLAFAFSTAGAFALMVPLLRDVIGLPAPVTGALLAADAIAGTLGALAAPRLARRFGGIAIAIVSMAGAALGIACLSVADATGTALAGLCIYGAAAWMTSTVVIGERQRRAPPGLQARVGIAGRMLLLGAVSAGAVIASALTGALSVRAVYGVMAATGAVVLAASTPALLRSAPNRQEWR